MPVASRFTILAVCTANICRSPLMEHLLRHHLDLEHFEVASAGVMGWEQAPMDEMAAMELGRLGVTPGSFRSHRLESYLIDSADLILTATKDHRSAVLELNPLALRRTFTLLEFAGLVQLSEPESLEGVLEAASRMRSQGPKAMDIEDPYRRSPDVHRGVADNIAGAVESISRVLNSVAGKHSVDRRG